MPPGSHITCTPWPVSSVQPSKSSSVKLTGISSGLAPPVHAPVSQASPTVVGSPSSHGVPFAFCAVSHSPVAGLQPMDSTHCSGGSSHVWLVPAHSAVSAHLSFCVHGSPSLHGVSVGFGSVTQPCAGRHAPVAHSPLRCVQSRVSAPQAHAPFAQPSPTVQRSPSLQGWPFSTGAVTHVPLGSSQSAVWQAGGGGHSTGAPSRHSPPAHSAWAMQRFEGGHSVPSGFAADSQAPAAAGLQRGSSRHGSAEGGHVFSI